MKKISPLLFLLFSFFSCKKNTTNIHLEKGIVISESVTVLPDTFKIDGKNDSPAILIEGDNIIVDFQGAILKGSNGKDLPNELFGIGLLIKGKNIEIENLHLSGYYLGILATQSDNLKINNCHISYNFRCKNEHKNSIYKCSQPVDTKFGKIRPAGLFINHSQNVILNNNQITHNNTGVILEAGVSGDIYNNKVTFNLNAGLVDNGNRDLKIMHNYLCWNRGYGLTCSNDSKNLLIAYNAMRQNGSNLFWKNTNFSNDLFPQKIKEQNQDSLQKLYPPLSDGQTTLTPLLPFTGEEYWLETNYGFYDFNYPTIWLREVNDDKYTFAIFGPEGNWKVVDGNGFIQTSRQSGSIPATMVATKMDNSNPKNLSLNLEFIGIEFTDQFGNLNPRGKTYNFQYKY